MKNNKKTKAMQYFVVFVLFCFFTILGINVISQNKEVTANKATIENSQTNLQDSDETQKLIKILTDKKESAEVILATIKTLGNMKADDAIPILTEYLDYEKICNRDQPEYVEGVKIDGTEIGPRRTCGSYPASISLIQIGKPSLPALAKLIEEEKSDTLRSQNALYTIQQIFVGDLSEGVKYLQDAMKASVTQLGKQRLSVALEKTRTEYLRLQNQDAADVQKLIQILEDSRNREESPQLIVETIQKLGSIRDARATPILIKYLDYERKFEPKQNQDPNLKIDEAEITHWSYTPGRYPAVGSLFQIGKSTLPALIGVIENEEITSKKSQNALEVVLLIFRDDLSEGVKYLEDAMNASDTQEEKLRLSVALEKTRTECIRIQNL